MLAAGWRKRCLYWADVMKPTFADIHALPAYGRDYKSAQAVLADWKAGKDFLDFLEGFYFSIRDSRPEQVWVRYDKRTKLVRVQ